RAFDGTISIIQPLIEPLYAEAKSVGQLISALLDKPSESSHDVVKNRWQKRPAQGEFETSWRRSLHDGYVYGSSLPAITPALEVDGVKRAVERLAAQKSVDLTLVLRPDPSVHDGRYANNGW